MPTRSVMPFELTAGTARGRAAGRAHRGQGWLRVAAPSHPLLVHFTIALSVSAFCFDLLAALFGIKVWATLGWWLLAAAVPVTIAALVTGLKSRLQLPVEEGAARSFLRVHMALAPTVLGLLILIGCWRAWLWQAGYGVSTMYLVAMFVVLLVIAVQGYLGGELVYRYGAAVSGRYRRLPVREPAAAAPVRAANPADMESHG